MPTPLTNRPAPDRAPPAPPVPASHCSLAPRTEVSRADAIDRAPAAASALRRVRTHGSPGRRDLLAIDPTSLELSHVELRARAAADSLPTAQPSDTRSEPDRDRVPVPASAGLCIAFLGCDGSGKSTVTREIRRWLSTCLDVEFVYMGSGEGTSSLLRRPLLLLHRLATRIRSRRHHAPSGAIGGGGDARALGPGRLRELLRPVWALLLAREKRIKLAHLERRRNSGAVVLCDRYPQNEIEGFNDGPLLAHWQRSGGPLRRALARWEREPYRRAELQPPDLVVKLHVSVDVARRRKPDMNADEIRRRIAAVDALRIGGAPTLHVDTDAPLAEVLAQIKRAIWETI